MSSEYTLFILQCNIPCVLGTLYSWSLILYGTVTDPRRNVSDLPAPPTTSVRPTGTVTISKKPARATSGRRICFSILLKALWLYIGYKLIL